MKKLLTKIFQFFKININSSIFFISLLLVGSSFLLLSSKQLAQTLHTVTTSLGKILQNTTKNNNFVKNVEFSLSGTQGTVTPFPTGSSSSSQSATTVTPPSYTYPTALPTSASNINVIATVNPSVTGLTVPSRFAGLSFEMEMLCNTITLDSQSSSYSQLFKNLGNQTLRIGGNQGDFASWAPNGTYSCANNSTVLTKALVDSFVTFANKIGWNFTWAVNLGTYDPTTFADEANYVMTSGGSSLYAIAIGNEPDFYHSNGLRTSSYVYASYKPEWEAYKSDILGLNASIPFMGDDQGSNNTWFSSFLTDESSGIILSGVHYYPTKASGTGAQAATAANLLSNSLMSTTVTAINAAKTYADAHSTSFALTETNSASGGGASGVSDTFTATLWGLDYIFSALEDGVKKIEFHQGSSGAAYAVIDSNGNPKPLYYALLFFENAFASGNVITTKVQKTSINTVVHSVLGTDGKLHVAVINKDLTSTAVVDIHTTKSYSSATSLTLTAPTVSSTTSITFGGNAVASDGTWTANTPTTVQLTNGTDAYVTVSPASAVLVTLQ